MSKEMTSLFQYKNLKKLEGKTYLLHIFLAWLLLLLNYTGFKMLGWAVGLPSQYLNIFSFL